MKTKIESPPVLFLVFNRLEYAKESFAQIQNAKPKKIYIASDGPRGNVVEEDKTVQAVRDYILKNINWKCQIKTLFREKNLGCEIAISEAITWFFQHEEMGIILEDDAVVSQSFFSFCSIILKKYKANNIIMAIGSLNYLDIQLRESYFFSELLILSGGWATWKRAWSEFSYNIEKQEKLDKKVYKRFSKFLVNYFYKYNFQYVDSWDTSWGYAYHRSLGLSITPTRNMLTNIGRIGGVHSTKKKTMGKRVSSYEKIRN